MGTIDFKKFDAAKVSLEGSNLVEASAGTGKTYSIAILTLRLILEKEIPVKEILMVTFTKAAVAELETRIRRFVRMAYKYSLRNSADVNSDIAKLVESYDKARAQTILKEAVRQLDEMSILTIHSFCQNTLTEFAFETGQGYNVNLLENLSEVIGDEVKDFWRTEVGNTDRNDLEKMVNELQKYKIFKEWFRYFSLGIFSDALSNCIDNKFFINRIEGFDFSKSIAMQENEIQEKMISHIVANTTDFIVRINSYQAPRYTDKTRATYISKLDNPQVFLDFIIKTSAQSALAIFEEEIKYYNELKHKKDLTKMLFFEQLIHKALSSKTEIIKQRLQAKNQVSFDDLIQNLHRTIAVDKNENLIALLKERYKAVFVDEFQDTDKSQFEIFNTTFANEESILFYIGDPKQSIYGWRKADINTYFEARAKVKNVYTMNTNYRSTQRLVDGLNEVFSERNYQNEDCGRGVGLFHNEAGSSAEKQINYQEVAASATADNDCCYLNGLAEFPLTIYEGMQNKAAILPNVIDLVKDLLTNGTLGATEKSIPIKASDIAILVRTGFEGKEIKNALDDLGIPSVLIDESKIFTTPETTDILYILQAIQDLSSASICKALLSKLTGYNRKKIEILEINIHVTRFKKYQELFNTKGVYTSILAFFEEYYIRKNLLGNSAYVPSNGLKSYANLLQLSEALQRIQEERGYELTELIAFVKKAIEGDEIEGDEYRQRIESDEDAIQITTIHKSKGLQYNLVIAPYLDLEVKAKGAFSSFRNAAGDYCFEPNYNKPETYNENFIIQNEQENRRLIYVVLTRAKYQLYLFTQNKGSLGSILKGKNNTKAMVIKNYEFKNIIYKPQTKLVENMRFCEPTNFNLKDKNWCKMSFSFLNVPHSIMPKQFNRTNEGYDYFIFKELERGAHVGNLVHSIFENIDFADSENWQKTIDFNLKRYIPNKQELYSPQMNGFLNHILETTIKIPGSKPFNLKQISNSKKLNELEFDINISQMDLDKLYEIQTESVQFSFKNVDLYGILNGKIDLFFEHDNKYYILDWKSNYLGDAADDYTPEHLGEAMNENNYHLQYYIYTMATKRFLESKITNFDYDTQFGGVIYLFLRGVRADASTGIFTTKLTLDTVKKMEEAFHLKVYS